MGRTSTKRGEILQFLKDFSAQKGYAPSVREIMQAVGLKSTASVHYHLSELDKAGLICVDGSKNRAITLPEQKGLPIVGVVTAGLPILAQENIEGYLPWGDDGECFALRVRGDSMIDAGILDGDKIVVHPQQTADNGQIVVTLLAPTSAYPAGTRDSYGAYEHVYCVYTIEPETMTISSIVLGIDQ